MKITMTPIQWAEKVAKFEKKDKNIQLQSICPTCGEQLVRYNTTKFKRKFACAYCNTEWWYWKWEKAIPDKYEE